MTLPVRDNIDLGRGELQNAKIQGLTTDPSSPVEGQVWYRTDLHQLFIYDGTTPQRIRFFAAITSGDIQDGTITDADVAAANKDGLASVYSMRRLGSGAQQAMAGNTTLDQLPAATAAISANGQKITSLADPTSAQDAATKNYVDGLVQGLDAKNSVKAASTGNLALSGTNAVDGVAIPAGTFVLAKNQTNAADNGIYVTAAGGWTRRSDMDVWGEVPGAFVFVEQGTANAETGWVSTADQGGTIGSTAIPWTQFSSAGSYTAGNGLALAGSVFSAVAGNGITVGTAIALNLDAAGALEFNGTAVRIKLDGATLARSANGLRVAGSPKVSTNVGDGTALTYNVNHGLNDTNVIVQVYNASGVYCIAGVTIVDANNITVTFSSAPAMNAYRVVVMA